MMRTKKSAVVVLVCLMALSSQSLAAERSLEGLPSGIAPEEFHLYLLMGQSNMAGRGEMTDEDRQPVSDVYVLNQHNQWKPASHPLHFDKPRIAGVGLGIDFAKQMILSAPGTIIGLIPCAVGGTKLAQWRQGGNLYNSALARTQVAIKAGELQGILWHQGEGDSSEKRARSYSNRLAILIANLRKDLHDPQLPFVLGELGEFRDGEKSRSDIVIEQQRMVPARVPRTACVSAAGLRHKGDGTHFDAESMREYGRRYAKSMQALQSQLKVKSRPLAP